jgi:hypothetical protein
MQTENKQEDKRTPLEYENEQMACKRKANKKIWKHSFDIRKTKKHVSRTRTKELSCSSQHHTLLSRHAATLKSNFILILPVSDKNSLSLPKTRRL